MTWRSEDDAALLMRFWRHLDAKGIGYDVVPNRADVDRFLAAWYAEPKPVDTEEPR